MSRNGKLCGLFVMVLIIPVNFSLAKAQAGSETRISDFKSAAPRLNGFEASPNALVLRSNRRNFAANPPSSLPSELDKQTLATASKRQYAFPEISARSLLIPHAFSYDELQIKLTGLDRSKIRNARPPVREMQ